MQPDIDNIKDKLEKNRDFLAKITEKLPGYKGWGLRDKKERYDVDQILREFMVMKIQDCKTATNRLSSELFKTGDHSVLQDIDSLNNEFERVMKKCQHADYAKSAKFSNLKIGEEDEYRLLEYDWRLIAGLDSITAIADSFRTPEKIAVDEEIKKCKELIREFEKNFDDRKYVIMEVI